MSEFLDGQRLLDILVDLKVDGVDISSLKVRIVIPQPNGDECDTDADEVLVDHNKRTLTIL